MLETLGMFFDVVFLTMVFVAIMCGIMYIIDTKIKNDICKNIVLGLFIFFVCWTFVFIAFMSKGV
mgnify:FL=1